jgi:hypothetical protein
LLTPQYHSAHAQAHPQVHPQAQQHYQNMQYQQRQHFVHPSSAGQVMHSLAPQALSHQFSTGTLPASHASQQQLMSMQHYPMQGQMASQISSPANPPLHASAHQSAQPSEPAAASLPLEVKLE